MLGNTPSPFNVDPQSFDDLIWPSIRIRGDNDLLLPGENVIADTAENFDLRHILPQDRANSAKLRGLRETISTHARMRIAVDHPVQSSDARDASYIYQNDHRPIPASRNGQPPRPRPENLPSYCTAHEQERCGSGDRHEAYVWPIHGEFIYYLFHIVI
jgi:hypothetical protein